MNTKTSGIIKNRVAFLLRDGLALPLVSLNLAAFAVFTSNFPVPRSQILILPMFVDNKLRKHVGSKLREKENTGHLKH